MSQLRKRYLPVIAGLFLLAGGNGVCFGLAGTTPLEFLKGQERKHREQKGQIYLGRVMIMTYSASSIEPEERYHSLLLELTDVLKTPLRSNYRLELRGYSGAGGSGDADSRLSEKRAERLKQILVKRYLLNESRISAVFPEKMPTTSTDTPGGRSLDRRVEIHVYGDVSEAIRFMGDEVGG